MKAKTTFLTLIMVVLLGLLVSSNPAYGAYEQDVTLLVDTNADTYYISRLQYSPIVVSVTLQNHSGDLLAVVDNSPDNNSSAPFGSISVRQWALKYGERPTCPACQAGKNMHFALPSLNSSALTSGPVDVIDILASRRLGIHIGAHSSRMVARGEIYLRDFEATPVPGAYIVYVQFDTDSLWFDNYAEPGRRDKKLTSPTGSTIIRLK